MHRVASTTTTTSSVRTAHGSGSGGASPAHRRARDSSSSNSSSSATTASGAAPPSPPPPATSASGSNLLRHQALQAKYAALRDELNRRGVFDAETNEIRVQTLLEAELGQRGTTRRHGGGAGGRRAASEGGRDARRPAPPTSRLGQLQEVLEASHERAVQVSDRGAAARRALEIEARARRAAGVGHVERDGGRAMGRRESMREVDAPTAAMAATGPPHHAQVPAALPATVPASQGRRGRISRANSIAGSERGSDSASDSVVVRVAAHGVPPALSETPARTSAAAMAPHAKATAHSREVSPAPDATSQPSASSPQVTAVELGAGAWLQRAAEHAEYPQPERELRRHLKQRDEARRDESPVGRYTRPWSQQRGRAADSSAETAVAAAATSAVGSDAAAARLPLDAVFAPASLADGVNGTRSAGVRPAAASPQAERSVDMFVRMASDHGTFVSHARNAVRRRREFKRERTAELLVGQDLLVDALRRSATAPSDSDSDSDYVFASSDDDGMEGVVDRTHAGSAKRRQRQRRPDEGGVRKTEEEEEEAVEVLECAVVCLCEAFMRRGYDIGPSRDTAVLRNVLIHALQSLLPAVRAEVDRRSEEKRVAEAATRKGANTSKRLARVQAAAGSRHGEGNRASAHRTLRSWTKGAEVLLMLELGCTREPFTMHNATHVDRLVKHYCALHRASDARARKLMQRWRDNRISVESAAINNDTEPRRAVRPDVARADALVDFFGRVASVTTDDLSRLDVGAANAAYRQRELAQTFLDRFAHFLPAAGGQHSSADPPPDHAQPTETSGTREDGTDPKSCAGLASSPSPPPPPTASGVEAGLLERPSALRLKHVLLRYVGLLSGGSEPPGGEKKREEEGLIARAQPRAISNFMNVFRSSWGRTPLADGVPPSEAAERAAVLEATAVTTLVDAYLHLLSEPIQDRFRFRVRAERERLDALEARLADDTARYSNSRQSGAAAPASAPGAAGDGADAAQEAADARAALRAVERQHLIEKYTRNSDDPAVLAELRRAVESSDDWYGYEASRRQASRAFTATLVGSAVMGSSEGVARGTAASGGEDGAGSDTAASSPSLPPEGSSDAAVPNGGSGAGDDAARQTRLEVLRIRKLQELEACWQALSIAYAQRIALHDKWNNASLEVRDVDRALRHYKICCAAVVAREDALQAVLANETNPDAKEKAVKRHVLFSAMCAAGQQCEMAAKKLLVETGDELYFKSAPYTLKLKDDFLRVAKLLRSPVI